MNAELAAAFDTQSVSYTHLEGLDVGEEYVSAGAFILKAEIGKNLAEHEH